jgi:5-oxoprolinase (ATP-hydrolysing)
MPPESRNVHEEGVLIDNVLLVDEGRFLEGEMRALLGSGRWPARNLDRNISDLKAQVAACARGAAELRRVAREQGRGVVDAYMGHVMANAEEAVRRLIGTLSDGEFEYELDNKAHVRVRVTVDRRRAPPASTSPGPAGSCRTISTRLIRSAARRRFTCFALWWTTRSR